MKIVVLDGYTLNPGDLSWDELKALGECTVYDRTDPEHIVERASDAEIVLTNKTPLMREAMRRLTKLKYIGVLATGYNIVNVEMAKKRGIVVTNVPDYGNYSVAQMVFALLLEQTQHVAHHAFTVRKGRWSRNPDYSYWLHPLIELHGLTMGIVGYGRIGQVVARMAEAFGMKVLVHTRTPRAGVVNVSLDELFSQSDVISLHCPLTPETEKMINDYRLAQMKPTAYLINTSRGGLVDEDALAKALNDGKIAGVGLDVLSEEPPPLNQPLFEARNCIITPHIAWATKAARARLMDIAVANIKAFLAGQPTHVVTEIFQSLEKKS